MSLQRKLEKKKGKTDFEAIELLDEIKFTNERLGKILTTKQKIQNELEIQRIYTERIRKAFGKFLINFVNGLKLDCDDVPKVDDEKLSFRCVIKGEGLKVDSITGVVECSYQMSYYNKKDKYKGLCDSSKIDKLLKMYADKNLKTKKDFSGLSNFYLPIHMYINDTKHTLYKEVSVFSSSSNDYVSTRPKIEEKWYDVRANFGKLGYLTYATSGFLEIPEYYLLSDLNTNNYKKNFRGHDKGIYLQKVKLENIRNIQFRIGKVDFSKIQFFALGKLYPLL